MKIKKFFLSILVVGLCFGMTVPAMAVVTKFSQDVNAAIDLGLTWLDGQGAFNNPSSSWDAAGLVFIALLEKRQSSDQNAEPQGYSNASPADKARMDNLAAFIIPRATTSSFYAYRDGGDLMALCVYIRTGGPNQAGAQTAINAIFDRIAANQNADGYWCYYGPGCNDSSTTQLVVAGLAAARGVFLEPAYSDPGRLAILDALTAKSRTAYANNGKPGDGIYDGDPNDGILDPAELGHPYTWGDNSMQQTASGLWIQQVGGADLNDAGVQGYLRWLRARYEYDDNRNADGAWSLSYYYYMWSSSKAYSFLEDSGVGSIGTNISVADVGTLPPGDAPAFATRLEHLDPVAVPQIALHGSGGAGYYVDPAEPQRWYFDYAYSIMGKQNASGQFTHYDGYWDQYSAQAYALLVLQRSVGGGCLSDTDGDGVCDNEDNCVQTPNPNQADADGDGVGDACEPPDITVCDADDDGDIDRADTLLIYRNIGQPASDPNDPMDPDRDNLITLKDVKICLRLITP